MDEEVEALKLFPAHSLGGICIGASLKSILTFVKGKKDLFPALEVHFSQTSPVTLPVTVNLPRNGTRLRFDGEDQRLRCIEVVDFAKVNLTYKGSPLGKAQEGTSTPGPSFRRIYQLFGAAFPGEYLPPIKGDYAGTYILSWPGIAFSFAMQHSAWSPNKDHVSLLGSQAVGPATHMVVFEGKSWPEACPKMFSYESMLSRNLNISSKPDGVYPADIDKAEVNVQGSLLLRRKLPAHDFSLHLNHTSTQDLITELGSPDAIYRPDRTTSAATTSRKRSDSISKPLPSKKYSGGSVPSSYSSTATDTYDTDFDSDAKDDDLLDRIGREVFWCYFDHGMDILLAPAQSVGLVNQGPAHTGTKLVVTKVVLHGNVPGTYSFNRHRRLRWQLDLDGRQLDSESSFDGAIKPAMLKRFARDRHISDMARGKVVNRSWGTASDDSAFFLPDAGAELIEGEDSEQWLGNTKLYHFPGLVFEVTESGAVTALTICS